MYILLPPLQTLPPAPAGSLGKPLTFLYEAPVIGTTPPSRSHKPETQVVLPLPSAFLSSPVEHPIHSAY